MSGRTLSAVCAGARVELASLCDLGTALVSTLGIVERAGSGRGADALTDPAFALDVLVTEPGVDAILVGRVIDYLRSREGSFEPQERHQTSVTLADAIASYEAGPLALMAKGTGHTYRTWIRRLTAARGSDSPWAVTAGDLKDLIAHHVLAARRDDERRRSGRSAEETAVATFRSLWGYLVEKGWADENIAMRLTKPPRAEPNRRPITQEEAVLLRHLAKATGRDPLLDEVTLTIPERLGLRRIELCRLRLCDLNLEHDQLEIWGKGDKPRTMPLPPQLAELLTRCASQTSRHSSMKRWPT